MATGFNAAPAAPPTPQEVTRKLSIHSVVRPKISPAPSGALFDDRDSDVHQYESDTGEIPSSLSRSPGGAHALGAIAERRRAARGPPLTDDEEALDDEDDDGEGLAPEEEDDPGEEQGSEWRAGGTRGLSGTGAAENETDLRSGYLWKKGERRPKTWRRRWFVLRSAHIAYYASSAEYELHRLLDLADVHACTPVSLRRHSHVFGLVTAARTYYLKAATAAEAADWCAAIKKAREELLSLAPTSSPERATGVPIPIPVTPRRASGGHGTHGLTSSESEDASPRTRRAFAAGMGAGASSPGAAAGLADPARTLVSGYLMKCGQKRKIWRKRYFVLNGEKLMYSASHMETKPHRQIALSQVLDAFEYEYEGGGEGLEGGGGAHVFKVVTTKRALMLSAPSEEEEIRWVSAVRALLARRGERDAASGV
ncbi:PH-domain-containing protein [Peniophora sp. CONT]|nr:PH-domain-containing protein [Peniophora sp. CONT]